jgi:uncharacterized protein with HEPN domain
MNRDRVWLKFMHERLSRLDACAAAGREVFLSDTMLQDAAVRNLQVLANTSERVSFELLDRHPEVEWQWLLTMRNMLVHEPLNVDPAWLWDCLEFDLPVLRQALDALLL